MKASEKVVSYFYDEELGNFCYGGGNPMRPHRVRLTHSLVNNYGMDKQLVVHRPRPQTAEQITGFHADGEAPAPANPLSPCSRSSRRRDLAAPVWAFRACLYPCNCSSSLAAEYVDFLRNATPDNQDEYMVQLRRFNMGLPGEADCPVFDGLFQYCQVISRPSPLRCSRHAAPPPRRPPAPQSPRSLYTPALVAALPATLIQLRVLPPATPSPHPWPGR